MSRVKTLLGTMRIPFLILPPACIFLGFSSAVWTHGPVSPLYLFLALIGGLSANISVNALNEYFDFKSGLDIRARRTPFSGGSGALPARPEDAKIALYAGLATFILTGLIGVYFLCIRGLMLLPLGLAGLLVIFTYTSWLSRSPFICLIAPGFGSGILMVMGTYFVLTGEYSWTAFIASLIPFFAISNLLLLNQFPDVEADRSVGRRHFPIIIGRPASVVIYGLFLLLCYASIIIGACLGYLPWACLLGLASLVIAVPALIGVYRYADDIEKLIPYMGLNILITIITPILVAIGLLIG